MWSFHLNGNFPTQLGVPGTVDLTHASRSQRREDLVGTKAGARSTEVLHLSEHEAYLRIEVAKASRKHPVLLEMLADGRLHLTGISILHPHLTKANCKTLLGRASHKSKRQILQLVAEIASKQDVSATIRKLPERQEARKTTSKDQL